MGGKSSNKALVSGKVVTAMGEVAAYPARLELHPILSDLVSTSGVGAEDERHVVGGTLVVYCVVDRFAAL